MLALFLNRGDCFSRFVYEIHGQKRPGKAKDYFIVSNITLFDSN